MQKIVQIKFGSHLYGTATEESDLDIKAIYLPSAQSILLQRVEPLLSELRAKPPREKNNAKDVDFEAYSPEKFLRLLAEGQTVALDILFAPNASMISEPHPLWREIKTLAPKILNKKTTSFIRYCRQQANKYGIKGSRVAAARQALQFLTRGQEQYGATAKLQIMTTEIEALTATSGFLSLGEMPQPDGSMTQYFEICGKKAMLASSIKSARAIAQRLMDEYSARTLAAENNAGIDWKALSHAVRVGYEAIEFLSTHKITFPRPEATHLLAIKQGKMLFKEVSEEIEKLLDDVETAAEKSTLPESYDEQIIDDFIENLHRKIVRGELL